MRTAGTLLAALVLVAASFLLGTQYSATAESYAACRVDLAEAHRVNRELTWEAWRAIGYIDLGVATNQRLAELIQSGVCEETP